MPPRFLKLFNELPPEGQQMLIEKHLANALDSMAKEKSDDILSAATSLRTQYSKAPKLELRKKRQQITMLMDELARDAKVSFIKERSNRDELLTEIIHTLVTWLNDIWSAAYEHHVNFALAHTCLVFVGDAMIQLQENASLGGCKCSVLGLPIDVKIKDRNGKIVQKFHVIGPQQIDQILLWIWRDVLVSIFVVGTQKDKDKVSDFLIDIESVFGVTALERLLQGGKTDNDSDYETEDEDDHFSSEEFECIARSSPFCPCSFHGKHWPESVNNARIPLRDHVESRLLSIFETSPSLDIYNSLVAISMAPEETKARLDEIIHRIAGYTPDNLVAALEIFNSFDDIAGIAKVLSEHYQLLRPRDWHKLQLAVSLMDADFSYREEVLQIVEKELKDCLHCIFATVRSSFCHIEEDSLKTELTTILKLQKSTPGRKGRIQDWVDRVVTSGTPMHPMAFAAMMMGLPLMPPGDEGDDVDVFSYMDFDPNDPDLDDIREEYRPNHRARFDGWKRIAADTVGGPKILTKLYTQAIGMMPWLQDADIVNEMIVKLGERPNKDYVLDALGSLNSFAKTQRKSIRMNQRTVAKKKTTAKTTTTTVINNPTAAGPSSAPLHLHGTSPTPVLSTGPHPLNPNAPPFTPHPAASSSAASTSASPSTSSAAPNSPATPDPPPPSLAHMAFLASALFGHPEDADSDMDAMYPPIPFEVFFPPADGPDDFDDDTGPSYGTAGDLDDVD
ncbi:hypothetical protein BJ165DRAFT_1350932 [Panaeolus papilionaceus]|nr:hypothetical protein BJ165DRAFT_1350932 [Panaeolus papilionaceus]